MIEEEDDERTLSLMSSECYEINHSFVPFPIVKNNYKISVENQTKFDSLRENFNFKKKNNKHEMKMCNTVTDLFLR